MKIHFIGIGGIGMSAVAGLAQSLGHTVTGSEDKEILPPSSTLLKDLNLQIYKSSEENILKIKPDLVVVGNAIKKEHPEVIAAIKNSIPLYSFPKFIRQYLLVNKKSIVVAGTHGKTTTASLLAFSLEELKEDPSFLVGGIIKNFNKNFKLGQSPWFILEGDEYPSAFFEPHPKFLYYQPYALILTSLEYDHVDVYRCFDDLKAAFKQLIYLLPREGILVYSHDDPELRALIKEISPRCKTISYGQSQDSDYRLLDYEINFNGEKFYSSGIIEDSQKKKFTLKVPLSGYHNLLNALSILALFDTFQFHREKILYTFLNFKGVKRRQEILGNVNSYLIVDDFAHHPTAVKVTLRELKRGYKPCTTILFFEPRTNSSKRKIFQKDYLSSLLEGDIIFLKPPPSLNSIPESERINLIDLKESLLQAGKKVEILEDLSLLKSYLSQEKKKTLIVFMSSAFMEKEVLKIFELLNLPYSPSEIKGVN